MIKQIKKFFASFFAAEDYPVEERTPQQILQNGAEIWKTLNEGIPSPVGIVEYDCNRIRIFSEKVAKLSPEDKDALRQWLKSEIHDLENNFAEHASSWAEEQERRQRQIYHHHLSAIGQ